MYMCISRHHIEYNIIGTVMMHIHPPLTIRQVYTQHTDLPYLCPDSQDYAVVAVGVGGKRDRGISFIKALGPLFIDVLLVFHLTPAGKKPQFGYSIHCDGLESIWGVCV